MARPNNKPELIWDRVDKTEGPNTCWPFLGALDLQGYGVISIAYRRWKAHRLAYKVANSDLSDEQIVMHLCDNPRCCNPKHLMAGSHTDNAYDKVSKGRQMRGEKYGNTKLKEKDIISIRQSSIAAPKVAKQYGVSKSLITAIRRRQRWAHVTD